MAWGTVFSAFPGMKIVHQPGKANVPADTVSRLRQEVPPMISPLPDGSTPLKLNSDSEGLTNLYKELGDKFKSQVMKVASAHVLANQIGVPEEYVSVNLENSNNYITTKSLNLLVHTSEFEVKKFMNAYNQDPLCPPVLRNNHKKKTRVGSRLFRALTPELGQVRNIAYTRNQTSLFFVWFLISSRTFQHCPPDFYSGCHHISVGKVR
jgi:hypothetical protein